MSEPGERSRPGPTPGGVPAGLDARLAAALERLSRALRAHLQDQATAHELSPLQVQLLDRLAAAPLPERRVGALARQFDVTAPTVSDAVTALTAKGRVPLVASRAVRLDLTPAGRRLASDIGAAAPLEESLAHLPAADKAVTLQVCLALIADLQRRGVISVVRTCTTCRFFVAEAHPGQDDRHHCQLLDRPLAAADLRVDCPEHEVAG